MKILVFGMTGMLGSMVHRHFKALNDFETYGASRRTDGLDAFHFDAAKPVQSQLEQITQGKPWDYWINCIGIIKPWCKDDDPAGVRNAIRVNAQFPHELASAASAAGARLIQIATDCVYSGSRGSYLESDAHDALDVYGKTKSLGEVLDRTALNIRASIIGPELKARLSLLEWFLAQPEGSELKGFTHHRWNGVTTLLFARLCEAIIRQGAYDRLVAESPVHHYVPADTVDKYELLEIFRRTFDKNVRILPVGDVGPAVDRTLATRFGSLPKLVPPVRIADDISSLGQRMAAFAGA